MLASGKLRASSTTSASCGWKTQASSDRPSAVRRARPARKSLRCISCRPVAAPMLPMIGLASQRGRVAHAAEASAAGAQVRLQHGLDAIAQREIGEADDAGGDLRRAVLAAVAHRRHAGDELRLAHRPHLDGAVRAIHRVALEEHGGHDVVPGAEIGQQLVQQIAVIRPDPQVMVRVDDRQLGLEDRLGLRPRQPRLVGRADAAVLRRARMRRLAHVSGCGGPCPGRGNVRDASSRGPAAPPGSPEGWGD